MSYRVRVSERRSPALAGVGDCGYESPPHDAEHARDLLRVLLGRDPEQDRTRWTSPLAGGTRYVELVADTGR